MKLSIITPVYKNAEALRKFLGQMKAQSNKNFEIIFIVDTNTEKVLEVIDEFKTLKQKIKLIFNTKRQGRTKAVKAGATIASGDYSVICTVSNSFKTDFVNNAIAVAKVKKTDIIEFKCSIKHPRRFEGKIRKTFNTGVNISEHPEVIAYSYPFDFNKLYKTELLHKVVAERPILEVNSRFTISVVYKALLTAETYSTTSKVLVSSKSNISQNFNPLKMVRQWKELFKFVEEKFDGRYTAELTYAKYFHVVIFLFAFVGVSKNKVLLGKLKKNFEESLETDFKDFFHVNKYALLKNSETKIIIANRTSSKLTKLFKEL